MQSRSTLLIGTVATIVFGAGATYAQETQKRLKFTFGGQINRGILFADDGVSTESFFVDNDNSSTRLRAQLTYDLGNVTIGGLAEYEFEFSSTAAVNQINTDISTSVSNERKFEVFAEGAFGKVSYGQGDSASNSVSEIDLSGTAVVGYSGVSDLAGGILFRDGAGALTSTRIGSAFSNFDGNSRIERFRYDTPTFNGFTVSGSLGEDSRDGLAVRYSGEFGEFKVAAAAAYSTREGADRVNASVSALHQPTGFNVTFATGSDDLDAGGRDPGFNYVKIGYLTDKIVSWGQTSFAIDYYDGSDVLSLGSDSEAIGLFAVQNIDRWDLQVYAGYRNYSLSAPGSTFQDIDALLIGARYRF